MHIFKSTAVVPSGVCPGVDFVVRKMTESRRDDLRLKLGVPLAKLGLFAVELTTLGNRDDEEAKARRQEIALETAKIENSDLVGVKIVWGLKGINGLQIDEDNVAATVDGWKDWPSELAAEAVQLINENTGLVATEIKNSPLRTISGEVVPQAAPDTTAELA